MTLVATCNTATALALNKGFLFRKDVCACVRVCEKPKAACLSNQALCFAAKWPAFCQNALVSPLKQPCFWSKSVQHAVTCPYVLHSRCGQTSIMQEYLSSSNVSEARHCLHKLAVPFFHHEVVKQALLRMMEGEQTQPALVQLLRQLSSSGDLSDSQMSRVSNS